jgi:hypothetical protein
MRVLILGGRAPAALDLARRFASSGATVHIADSAPCKVSSWSRAVSAAHRIAPPRHALAQFAQDIAGLIRTHGVDMVVPTCEEVFFLSRIRRHLPAGCNVFCAPFEQLRELHSKWRFLDLAQGCGAGVPVSACVDGLEAAREWASGRPVVLKPEYSRFGVHVRLYPNGIPPDAPPLRALGRWVVQEFHRGRELCSYSVAVAGKLTAHVVYEPRYRLGNSSSYYFEATEEPAVQRFVGEFAAKMRFTGQISFDWIRGDSGQASVLECNPRTISGVHLFSDLDALPDAMTGAQAPSSRPRPRRPECWLRSCSRRDCRSPCEWACFAVGSRIGAGRRTFWASQGTASRCSAACWTWPPLRQLQCAAAHPCGKPPRGTSNGTART